MTEEEFDSPFTFFQNLSCLLKIQVQKRDNFKIIEYVRLAPMPLANHSHIGEYGETFFLE